MSFILRAAALWAVSFSFAGSAHAQTQTVDVPPMEVYPRHIQAVIDQHRAAVLPSGVARTNELQGVFNRLKTWQTGQVLHVCFFDGILDTRSRIAVAAKQWEKSGAKIKLDLGDVRNPRLCTQSEINEIRIGFSYPGYWSLVGQDSINLAGQRDQSMNLALFDVSPPTEPEFTRVVLHEFGHALGLEHEHQNPDSKCEDQFAWDKIYAALAGAPNYWDKAKVDFNMRRLLNDGNLISTGFNKEAIMLYTFPAWMYKDGENSSCYYRTNFEISEGDRIAIAKMYPETATAAEERRLQDVKTIKDALSAVSLPVELRDRALQSLEVLASTISGVSKRDALQKLNAAVIP